MQEIITEMTANLQAYADKPNASPAYIERQNKLIKTIAATFNAQEQQITGLKEQLKNSTKPLGTLVDLHAAPPRVEHKTQPVCNILAVWWLNVFLPGVLSNKTIDQAEKKARIKTIFELDNVAALVSTNAKLTELKNTLLHG
jgi:hypothetical protein